MGNLLGHRVVHGPDVRESRSRANGVRLGITFISLLISLSIGACATAPKFSVSKYAPGTEGYGSKIRLSIHQAATGPHSTELIILTPKNIQYQYELIQKSNGRQAPKKSLNRNSREHSDWAVDQVVFNRLKKNETYSFRVKSKSGGLIDTRELETLPNPKKLRFAFFSCMDDTYVLEQKQIWREIVSHKPHVLLFIGDNVYADKRINLYQGPADPVIIWDRHVETRYNLEIFKQDHLIPSFYSWDDHDYGKNNGDRTFAHKGHALASMQDFFGRHTVHGVFERGPGLSSYLKMSRQRFFFFDNRSFRTPADNVLGEQTQWGREQEEWFFSRLKSDSSPAWLIQGDQYFGGYHHQESYEGDRPRSFKIFLERLKKNNRIPVVFLSGDAHRTEIMKIPASKFGYSTYELTSSPVHAKTFPSPWLDTPNPLQDVGVAEKFNYMVVNSQAFGNRKRQMLKADVTAYTLLKKVLFKRNLTVNPKRDNN